MLKNNDDGSHRGFGKSYWSTWRKVRRDLASMASDETCSECQESSDNSIGEVNSVSGSEVNAVGVAHTVFHVSVESDAIDTSQMWCE